MADYDGQLDETQTRRVVKMGLDSVASLHQRDGWWSVGNITSEGGCYVHYGNQNLLNGLLPCWELARMLGDQQAMDSLQAGIKEAFHFLAYRNGVVAGPGKPMSRPSNHSTWSNGHMYVLCTKYLDLFGDDPHIRGYRDLLRCPGGGFGFDEGAWGLYKFHAYNTLATLLYSCPEYKEAQ